MPGVDALIWPATIVIGAIIIGIPALFIFRQPIIRLIDRISKADKTGISFAESPQERGNDNKPTPLSFVELMNSEPLSATILEREKSIKEQLQNFDLKNDTEKIEALIRVTAMSIIETEFTNIAHTIFGSQLDLLVQLSGTSISIPFNRAELIFKQAQETYPDLHGNRSLDDWLRFLLSKNLISTSENKIDITRFGSDFLKFLIDARLAYPRHS